MKITNRQAAFNYQLQEKLEAGINLTGPEVKAVRGGKVDLTGSFVRIIGSEAYLVNAKIYPYEFARQDAFEQNRTRKLLLHKKEILALKHKMDGSSLTLVPVSLYTTRQFIKLEIALAKGKKQFEKRENIKKRDLERQVEHDYKEKLT